jgi:hypothetical protein
MTDFHRNIFFYYKGAAEHEQDREQQLEDNTTKALINTLEHCDPKVATTFLEWLGITAPGIPKLLLQKSAIGSGLIRSKAKRLLLAIVGSVNKKNESVCAQLPVKDVRDSRPDAWLYGSNYIVLLESKIGEAPLTLDQMGGHWEKLQPTQRPIVKTWAEVHEFVVTLRHELENTKSKWLLGQFAQYLEWTGMTEFVGLEEGMFEFFAQSEKDSDMKKWVRGAVASLADKVLLGTQGLKRFNKFYQNKLVGNIEPDHCWVAFGPGSSQEIKDVAHQTISLSEQSLEMFVNVELLPVVEKVRKKVKNDSLFRKVICELAVREFTVRIQERKPTGLPRRYDYHLIAEVEGGFDREGKPFGLKDPQSPGFGYILTLIQDIRYPYFSVRKRISRKDVLELSRPNGEQLVNEVTETLKAFHPLVEFING